MTAPPISLDADLLFAGSASPTQTAASHVVLRLGQLTLLDLFTSEQAVTEASRNLHLKVPSAVPILHEVVRACLRVVPDPPLDTVLWWREHADAKDAPLLAAATEHRARWLFSFNIRHYWAPQSVIRVERPGEFLLRVRELLSLMSDTDP